MTFWNFRKTEETMPTEPEGGAPDGELDIDGEIVADATWFSEGACVAREIREALKGYRNITVRINSPGGDVMAGADIYSALREHTLNGKGRVTVVITALAASAASIIAMAGDEIRMSPAAYMMIHNPWTAAIGDAREMRKVAKTLDVISEGLINAYQLRTGKTRDELKRMLDSETWMSAYTCVEEGFADGILGTEDPAAPRAAACLMSGRDHGWREIAALYGKKDPEEPEKPKEPEEPDEPDPDEPEKPEKEEPEEPDPDEPEKPEKEEPDETEPEKPEKPEPEEPEKEDPEDPEKPEKKHMVSELTARIAAMTTAMDAWEASW